MRRLLLIRHGVTAAVRTSAFADGESLEPAARTTAQELAGSLPARRSEVSGPEPACRESAAALGLRAEVAVELAGCDVGRWRRLALDEVERLDPSGLMGWLSDPEAAPHGGESLADFSGRVSAWMVGAANGDGFLVAVVDASVIKAAVCKALGAPLSAFWRLGLAPLTVTELHARDGRWTVHRMNAPLARRGGVVYGAADSLWGSR